MMSRNNASNKIKYRDGFAGIPRIVLSSLDYISLSANGIKLLLELARQYYGNNNGDLTCAFSVLRKRGFTSKSTIQRAKTLLLERHLIIETRAGIAGIDGRRLCSLYALTWKGIDEVFFKTGEPKHHRAGTRMAIRKDWSQTSLTKKRPKKSGGHLRTR